MQIFWGRCCFFIRVIRAHTLGGSTARLLGSPQTWGEIMSEQKWIVWGLDLSLFTGKLEAILRAKGIAYERKNITSKLWPQLARKVGIQHMPYIELPDGRFLSDTTLILRYLEEHTDGPTLCAAPGATRFMSRLIEDWADEYLWRPAMYYRWNHPDSREMMSGRIVDQFAIDIPAPRWLKKRMTIARQLGIYVKRDGVRTKAQKDATEALYLWLLDELNSIFERRPFLLGDRPCEADFGLFAPFFRHFFADPVPGPIMQDRAPYVLLWAARLWATKPADFEQDPLIGAVPDDLTPILSHIGEAYLPYLRANAQAVAKGEKWTKSTSLGVEWQEFTKPFRLWCLSDLQDQFAALSDDQKTAVETRLGKPALDLITAPLPATPDTPPGLPITPKGERARDSWMR